MDLPGNATDLAGVDREIQRLEKRYAVARGMGDIADANRLRGEIRSRMRTKEQFHDQNSAAPLRRSRGFTMRALAARLQLAAIVARAYAFRSIARVPPRPRERPAVPLSMLTRFAEMSVQARQASPERAAVTDPPASAPSSPPPPEN